MGKRIKTQQAIIEALKELKRREGKDWISVHIIILMIYRRHQIDPQHKDYKGKDWTYRPAEARAVYRALGALERKKKIVRRKVRAVDRYPELPKDKRYGGIQVWTEIRLKESGMTSTYLDR